MFFDMSIIIFKFTGINSIRAIQLHSGMDTFAIMLKSAAFIASNLPAIQINLAIIHPFYNFLNYQFPVDFIFHADL